MGIPIIPCGHSQWVLVPCGHPQPFFLAKTYPATTCPVGIPNCCYMPCGHSQSSQFTLCPIFPVVISMPRGLTPITTNMPGGHFPILPCGYSHSHMPCGHSQKLQCPVGTRNAFFFSEDLPCHDMPCGLSQWLFICPVGIPNPDISYCAPYDLWSSVRPVGFPTWPPICPVGISHSALWVFRFPYALWAFPTSSNAPWARATLSFSVKTYPAMTCPAGIPNGCLYALWAFPILIFHIVPHMTCGHQYALWAFPHGHQYALWAFPILPCGYSLSHMPCGHSQQAPMPHGHAQPFLFQWRLTLQWHALRAFRMVAYMPCGHSQS